MSIILRIFVLQYKVSLGEKDSAYARWPRKHSYTGLNMLGNSFGEVLYSPLACTGNGEAHQVRLLCLRTLHILFDRQLTSPVESVPHSASDLS